MLYFRFQSPDYRIGRIVFVYIYAFRITTFRIILRFNLESLLMCYSISLKVYFNKINFVFFSKPLLNKHFRCLKIYFGEKNPTQCTLNLKMPVADQAKGKWFEIPTIHILKRKNVRVQKKALNLNSLFRTVSTNTMFVIYFVYILKVDLCAH